MPLSNKRLLSNRRPAPLMTIYSKTIGISKKEQFSQFLAWLIRVSAFYVVQCQVQSRGRLTMSTQWSLAWENSRHLTTLPLVSPPNDVWDPSAEIPYWWRVTLASSVWNFCARFSDFTGSARGVSDIPVYPKKNRRNTQIYPKLYPGILYTWNSKKVIYRIPVFKLLYTVYPI